MQGSPPVRAVRARTKHEETQLEDQLSGMLKHEGDGSRVGQCRAECKSLLLLLLLSRFSRVRLCDPIDSSPPGSSVPGILQARTLEWVAISFSEPERYVKEFCTMEPACCGTRPKQSRESFRLGSTWLDILKPKY